MPGLQQRNSPSKANYHLKGRFDKPTPSQTPRMDGGAKKLAVNNQGGIGFQKQRPGSAAYGVYKQAAKPKPLGSNNGRYY